MTLTSGGVMIKRSVLAEKPGIFFTVQIIRY